VTELQTNEGLLPTSLEQVRQMMSLKDEQIAALQEQIALLHAQL